MIEYVKVTNHLGEFLILELRSPEKSGFFVRGIEGLGPTKNTINTSQSLTLDGSIFNSARAASRNLVFDLGFYDGQDNSIELARQQTYRFFPIKKLIEVEIKTENRLGKTWGYVESNEPDIFSKRSTAQISIICPSAYFVGSDFIQTVFSGVAPGFEFPFENTSLTLKTIEFGQVFINTASNVFYTGDVDTGILIYVGFNGAVNNLTIVNATNGETMAIDSAKVTALTGSNFVAGDFLIISTVVGDKYIYLIRNGVTYNILNALSVLAEWFTIQRGDNVLTYTAGSGLANMQFLVQHRTVYQGL